MLVENNSPATSKYIPLFHSSPTFAVLRVYLEQTRVAVFNDDEITVSVNGVWWLCNSAQSILSVMLSDT